MPIVTPERIKSACAHLHKVRTGVSGKNPVATAKRHWGLAFQELGMPKPHACGGETKPTAGAPLERKLARQILGLANAGFHAAEAVARHIPNTLRKSDPLPDKMAGDVERMLLHLGVLAYLDGNDEGEWPLIDVWQELAMEPGGTREYCRLQCDGGSIHVQRRQRLLRALPLRSV